jgi:enoyl-CoA hydratase/carnithine racemase
MHITLSRAFSGILLKSIEDKVCLLTFNKPAIRNALGQDMLAELNNSLLECDSNDSVGCIVLTGDKKCFASGGNPRDYIPETLATMYKNNIGTIWTTLFTIRKPVIAAVNGYCLGGGFQVALMCDIITCGDKAVFGHPEMSLGVVPGVGGTQRLPRFVGKSLAMEMILSARFVKAEEAVRRGLVAKMFHEDDLIPKTLEIARSIAKQSQPIAKLAKECVNMSYEGTLEFGLEFEQRMFHASFGFDDRREGMKAFVEKRLAQFEDK